jgi:hypothetical protein
MRLERATQILMPEEKKDQFIEGLIEGDKDKKPNDNKSEKTEKEPITLEKVAELTNALQKGYTLTRQDLSEIRENMTAIVESMNLQKKEAGEDKDAYVTVGKLEEVLSKQAEKERATKEEVSSKVDNYIDSALQELRLQGVVKSDAEEEELIQFALDKKEPDLYKAAERLQEVREAREEGKKGTSKAKAHQEAGSKVGTSQKTTEEQGKGVDIKRVKETDFFGF